MSEQDLNLLTDTELHALDLLRGVATLLHEIIVGDSDDPPPQAVHDWNEAARDLHTVQHRIMAQAAARAYPERFRLQGSL